MKKWGMYECSVIGCFIIVPVTGILINYYTQSNIAISNLFLKWFVFSGVGLRLMSAGIMQIINPNYTSSNIFHIEDEKANALVREIGFSNISLAIPALMAISLTSFQYPIGIAGCLYYGLAAIGHVKEKDKNMKEIFAEISDLFMFALLIIVLLCNA